MMTVAISKSETYCKYFIGLNFQISLICKVEPLDKDHVGTRDFNPFNERDLETVF